MNIAAMQICRGLSFFETGLLMGALRRGTSPSTAILTAAQRCPPDHTATALHDQIRTRTQTALAFSLKRVHTSWWTSFERLERPSTIALMRDVHQTPNTALHGATATWLQHRAADRFGWLDPRHRWEIDQGAVLEWPALALLPEDDLMALLEALGMEQLSAAMHGAGRRELATVGRQVGPRLAAILWRRLQNPQPISDTARSLSRHALLMLAQKGPWSDKHRIERLGLYMLACGGAGRWDQDVRALAHSLPLTLGSWLLHCQQNLLRGPAIDTLSAELSRRSLSVLRHLSAQGLTQGRYHRRIITLRPPTRTLPDEAS